MTKDRIVQLIRELEQATKQDKIRWHPTAKEGAYRVGLGDGMLRIQPGDDPLDNYIVVVVLDRQGQVIDQYSTYDTMGDQEADSVLKSLYGFARASALNVDKVIDSMLADLKEGRTRVLPPENEQSQKPNVY